MSDTLTREQALHLAQTRAPKGMPLSGTVVLHLLDIIREALAEIERLRAQGVRR